MSQMNAQVCIIKVDRIIPARGLSSSGYNPAQAVINLRHVGDGSSGTYFCGMTLPWVYLSRLLGQDPVVGESYKIVTTPGQW